MAAAKAVQELIPNRGFDLFRPAGSNAAVVLSKEENFVTEYSTNLWPTFRNDLSVRRAVLDNACTAILAGPIRFEPAKGFAGDFDLTYLAEIRSLAAALAARTLLELHDQHTDAAWTNLLALTRLVTAWETEPVELAHMVKLNCVTMAVRATWEALRVHALNAPELTALTKEWDQFDPFRALPDTAELWCALALRCSQNQREKPVSRSPTMRQAAADLLTSPARAWSEATWDLRESRYRNYGSYEDELAAMTYYGQRQEALFQATKTASWAEMRLIPGVTNAALFPGGANSRLQGFASTRTGSPGPGNGIFSRQRLGLASRAAEAETRSRLVRTALALENFYLARGAYPKSLDELSPNFTAKADFMDGKPLRYRLIANKDFLLYSTGLDCVDNGGQMGSDSNMPRESRRGFFRPEEPDMVWPGVAARE